MNIKQFIEKVSTSEIKFQETMNVIDSNYNFTPTSFSGTVPYCVSSD